MSVRYFPYCPGIAWQIKNNVDVIPKLNIDNWKRALDNREAVIINFGGLFESFISLSYFEFLNKLYPQKKLYFNGKEQFYNLINLNGLANCERFIDETNAAKYPLPIFLDKGSNTYFNCLNNYINTYSCFGKFRYKNFKSLSEQLFLNLCNDWNINYIPQFRHLKIPKEFSEFKTFRKFDIDKPFIVIFPDNNSGLSIHSISMLGWNVPQIKSFVSMVQAKGIQTVIVTKNIGKYTGINSLVLSPKFETILCLIEKSSVILSEEIDFLLIGLLLSKNAKIIARDVSKEFSIKNNQKYLQTDKKLFLAKNLEPIKVYKEI